jgi:hypothetical protein
MVDIETDATNQLKWSNFNDQLKEEYEIQMNDMLIIECLSRLAMKHGEMTRDLINHITLTETMVIIKESYAEYQNKVLEPNSDLNGGVMMVTLRKYMADNTANMMNFFKMNLFWAALLAEL